MRLLKQKHLNRSYRHAYLMGNHDVARYFEFVLLSIIYLGFDGLVQING